MKKTVMDGNMAAAWGVRLSDVKVVPNFPITPQTELIETLARWKVNGEWNGEFVNLEGEHSVMSAAIAAEATGVRTFTASSSQGTLYMHEVMYVASGMRLPIVMVNVSRGLSAPITLWTDHNDMLAMRDSGWLMFFTHNNQEVLDSIIQAYKISEDKNVMLPTLINMEGFIQSYTREPVSIPDQKTVRKFLPKYKPHVVLNPDDPMCQGIGAMGKDYMKFRAQQHKAQLNALKKIKDVGKEFGKVFGRSYGLVEKYKTDDADFVFVSMGALSTTIKETVNRLRSEGKKVGLLRIRTYRPFPEKEIKKILKDVKTVAVIDNNVAPGYGGILYPEIKSALYGTDTIVSDFIVGLGGTHTGVSEFNSIYKNALKNKKSKRYWLL
ncbi:MAG: pyruvate ferredoxin oxidoreductase [Candidatus Aenigmarchaeota archaeon]|nr:pyruvate ferredoxin oxidoreductase [Candidatus Aenigmarchaeota archaeon]